MEQFFIVQTNWDGGRAILSDMPFPNKAAAERRAETMRFASHVVKVTPQSRVYFPLGRVTAPQEIDQYLARRGAA